MATSTPAIDAFWRAFASHAATLAQPDAADDPAYDLCLEPLKELHPSLFLEMCTHEGASELVVTSEGDRDAFPLVREIVARAPKVPGWSFTALKPKIGFPETTTWEGVEVTIADVLFEPLESDSDPRLGLRLYVPELDPDEAEETHNAILAAIDHGLGEEAFAELVGYTDLAEVVEGLDTSDFIPLVELEQYLEWRAKQRRQ